MAHARGSCLCGQVTYEVTEPLREVIVCHCGQCRKTSGHYVAATSAALGHLHITGEVTWFRSSETARRGFCGTCGSNLFWWPDAEPRMSIFSGTLDGATGLRVTSQICTADKGDYYDLPDVPIHG